MEKPAPEHDPLLCDVIQQNIQKLSRLRAEARAVRGPEEKLADAITDVSGRMSFVYFHLLWFGLWIGVNSGHFGLHPFDPFPYGLLTMIVSLEAIFLATFVLISQNRLSAEAERRADLALQIGLLTEHEVTRVLQMLDAIQDKMGIENDQDSELAQLETQTKPEDVLAAIRRMESRRPPA
jgi:uncharacterized membrane protein